jgi:hypothetical protein
MWRTDKSIPYALATSRSITSSSLIAASTSCFALFSKTSADTNLEILSVSIENNGDVSSARQKFMRLSQESTAAATILDLASD